MVDRHGKVRPRRGVWRSSRSRRRAIGVAAVGVLALTAGACGRRERAPQAQAQAPVPPNIAERVRVLNVDAMVIDGVHIRLAGYYGPQGIPDSRCWAEALTSKQSTEAVRRMVASANSVRFELTGGTDPFVRKYGRVILDGVDLGQTLYDQGMLAKSDDGFFGWCGPLSQNEPGAPELRSLFDMGR